MDIKILYFSGTGNSLAAARQINKAFINSEIVPITYALTEIEADKLIIVVPTYAYGSPAVVLHFMQTASIKTNHISFLATCGSQAGSIFLQAKRVLKKRGLLLNYFNSIKTVENFFPLFKRGTVEAEKKRIKMQKEKTDIIIKDLKGTPKRKRIFPNYFGLLIDLMFRKFRVKLNKKIRITDDCIGCMVCVAECQVKAITVEKGHAKINPEICQNCQGCINKCPLKAIEYGKVNKMMRRYVHPDGKKI